MTAFEKVDRFVRNLYATVFYLAGRAWKENFRNYIGRAGTVGRPRPVAAILGNGPSLGRELPRLLESGAARERDFMAVNFFALDERFD